MSGGHEVCKIHGRSTDMRTRRALRHSNLAPYGAKTAYVGGVTASRHYHNYVGNTSMQAWRFAYILR